MRGRAILPAMAMAMACGFQPRGQASDGGDDGVDAPTAPDDGDGDGVRDTVDNCPEVANPAQHDEDGDATGDACDPCPQLAGGSASGPDADADGDGVGDGCDPRPNLAGDTLVMFEAFATPGPLPASLTVLVGTASRWAVDDDALHYRSFDQLDMVVARPGGAGRLTTDTVFDVVAAGGTSASTAAVMANLTELATPPNALQYFLCGYRDDANGRELWMFDGTRGMQWTFLDSDNRPRAGLGARRVVASVESGGPSCVVTDTTGDEILNSSSAPFTGDAVGLRLFNMQVRIPYLAIYRSPTT
ncbi:MAG: thrombospondin type 3 repeat-containing protein [Kofleriaceae bacterium]